MAAALTSFSSGIENPSTTATRMRSGCFTPTARASTACAGVSATPLRSTSAAGRCAHSMARGAMAATSGGSAAAAAMQAMDTAKHTARSAAAACRPSLFWFMRSTTGLSRPSLTSSLPQRLTRINPYSTFLI